VAKEKLIEDLEQKKKEYMKLESDLTTVSSQLSGMENIVQRIQVDIHGMKEKINGYMSDRQALSDELKTIKARIDKAPKDEQARQQYLDGLLGEVHVVIVGLEAKMDLINEEIQVLNDKAAMLGLGNNGMCLAYNFYAIMTFHQSFI
jgi:septal ring factor EnvC (AmiA/AmiB activator)